MSSGGRARDKKERERDTRRERERGMSARVCACVRVMKTWMVGESSREVGERALLLIYMAVLRICMMRCDRCSDSGVRSKARLWICVVPLHIFRALLRICSALLWMCRAVSWIYQALLRICTLSQIWRDWGYVGPCCRQVGWQIFGALLQISCPFPPIILGPFTDTLDSFVHM